MRKKFARSLRKWADLIDPRIEPSNDFTIRIDIDAVSAEETLRRLESRINSTIEAQKRIHVN